MWPDAGTPYLDMYIRDSISRRNRRSRQNGDVVHHETCPCCGRKLVNLYRGGVDGREWKCKKCWDAEKGENT